MYLNDNTPSRKKFWLERINSWGKGIEEGMYIFSNIIPIKNFLRIKLCKCCLWTEHWILQKIWNDTEMSRKWMLDIQTSIFYSKKVTFFQFMNFKCKYHGSAFKKSSTFHMFKFLIKLNRMVFLISAMINGTPAWLGWLPWIR